MKAAYFSHDEDARNDPKMIKIRLKYGIEGYGCYFAILEMFNSEDCHALDYSQEQFDAIAYELHTKFDTKEFIDKCIEVGLFTTDGERFWSESFNRRFAEIEEKANARSQIAEKAAAARWNKQKKKEQGEPPKQPDGPEPLSTDLIDPEWRKVVQAYEANIGMIPVGVAGERLVSYYEDMGADVMIEAIKVTNLAHPNNPNTFLNAILKKWIEMGVDSAEKAKAVTLEHIRKNEQRNSRQTGKSKDDGSEQNSIRGKFY